MTTELSADTSNNESLNVIAGEVGGQDTSTTFLQRWLSDAHGVLFSAYCIAAAFGTYFCMYAFRKPFTAGTFEGLQLGEMKYKAVLIASQTMDYTLSKFIGIKVVSEMSPQRRGITIVFLIAIAQLALLLFAVIPPPYNWVCLFLNGLPLGIVFGLVLAFLEGRRFTEALSAGLCASFIMASGVVKSVGAWLIIDFQVSEFWMPFTVGMLFFLPLLFFVWLLRQIPPPKEVDVVLRSKREPMDRAARMSLFWRHRWGLTGLVTIYLLLSIGRGIRDDFAVEIWREMGYDQTPSIFAKSETLIMLGVVAINGLAILIRSNRRAFLGSLGLLLLGFAMVLSGLALYRAGYLDPFAFMVLVGLGTYVPYVAFHTTIFERFIAAFREVGTIGFLMYLADSFGYLGYVLVVIGINWRAGEAPVDYLPIFIWAVFLMGILSIAISLVLIVNYALKLPHAPVVDFHAAEKE